MSIAFSASSIVGLKTPIFLRAFIAQLMTFAPRPPSHVIILLSKVGSNTAAVRPLKPSPSKISCFLVGLAVINSLNIVFTLFNILLILTLFISFNILLILTRLIGVTGLPIINVPEL